MIFPLLFLVPLVSLKAASKIDDEKNDRNEADEAREWNDKIHGRLLKSVSSKEIIPCIYYTLFLRGGGNTHDQALMRLPSIKRVIFFSSMASKSSTAYLREVFRAFRKSPSFSSPSLSIMERAMATAFSQYALWM